MDLVMCEKIRLYLRSMAPIMDGKTKLNVKDFTSYVLIRDAKAKFIDVDKLVDEYASKLDADDPDREYKIRNKRDEIERLYYTIANNQKLATGSSVAFSTGFYVIPLYSGMDDVRYLIPDAKEQKLALSEKPLFKIDSGTFNADNLGEWQDYPVDIFNDACYDAGVGFNLESRYPFRGEINSLASLVKCLEITQKNRIDIGNSITNKMRSMLGPEEYKELKRELGCTDMDENGDPKKSSGVDMDKKSFIDMLYKAFKEMLESRPISDATGKPKAINKVSFKPSKAIPDYMIFNWLKAYHRQTQSEQDMVKAITEEVESSDIYNFYLSGIKGLGPKHAAYLLAYLDPKVCRHPSGFIRYLGLDVLKNDKGQDVARNCNYMRDMPYLSSDGHVKINRSRGFHAKMKARIWLIVDSMIKAKDPKYYQMYLDFKSYYTNRPDLAKRWANKSKDDHSTPNRMAIRKTMYRFVIDLWINERRILGLPLNGGSYEEAKLGIKHNYGYEYPKPTAV